MAPDHEYVIHISCRSSGAGMSEEGFLMLLITLRKPHEGAAAWRKVAKHRPPVLCVANPLLGDLADQALDRGYRVRIDSHESLGEVEEPIWCEVPGQFTRFVRD